MAIYLRSQRPLPMSLPNADRLQKVTVYVKGCTWQLKKTLKEKIEDTKTQICSCRIQDLAFQRYIPRSILSLIQKLR